jgi:hypothetical protein
MQVVETGNTVHADIVESIPAGDVPACTRAA